MVEVIIAGVVSIGVIGAAWSLFLQANLQGAKAQALSGAVQSAAYIMNALQDDLANIQATESVMNTVSTTTDAVTGQVVLEFTRRAEPIDFDSVFYKDFQGQKIQYIARPQPPHGLFQIMRVVDEETPQYFGGIYASQVRFSTTSTAEGAWVRASFMLLGENVDPRRVAKQAMAQNTFLLSSLFHVPVRPRDDLDPTPAAATP